MCTSPVLAEVSFTVLSASCICSVVGEERENESLVLACWATWCEGSHIKGDEAINELEIGKRVRV